MRNLNFIFKRLNGDIMDFKCFMKLLEEKKYITKVREFEVDSEIECGNIAIDYKCKYEEVKKKIMDEIDAHHKCNSLLNVKYQIINHLDDDEIKIINLDLLEHHIWNKYGEKEEKIFKSHEVGYIWLESALENSVYYEAKYNNIHDHWKVTDLFLKKQREDDEKREYEKCLEFLKQLP